MNSRNLLNTRSSQKMFQNRHISRFIGYSRTAAILWISTFLFLTIISCSYMRITEGVDTSTKRYDVFELSLQGSNYTNPYTDAPSTDVTFTGPDGTVITMPAFWNGGIEWLVRMAPAVAGEWNYSVSSGDTNTNGKTGSFTVGSGMGGLNGHGMVEVDPVYPHKFCYSDGTPFFFMGHSIEWCRQPADLLPSRLKSIIT